MCRRPDNTLLFNRVMFEFDLSPRILLLHRSADTDMFRPIILVSSGVPEGSMDLAAFP